MGNKSSHELLEQDEVDKVGQVNLLQKKMPKEFKILMLGAGESGKSTLFKHLRFLYTDSSYFEKEKGISMNSIYANLIFSFERVLFEMNEKNLLSEEEKVKKQNLTSRIIIIFYII